jgi:hypothetical protein
VQGHRPLQYISLRCRYFCGPYCRRRRGRRLRGCLTSLERQLRLRLLRLQHYLLNLLLSLQQPVLTVVVTIIVVAAIVTV